MAINKKTPEQIATLKAEFWRNRCKVTEEGCANMIERLSQEKASIQKDYNSLCLAHSRLIHLLEIVIDNERGGDSD